MGGALDFKCLSKPKDGVSPFSPSEGKSGRQESSRRAAEAGEACRIGILACTQ
jgi:hypothetical protein